MILFDIRLMVSGDFEGWLTRSIFLSNDDDSVSMKTVSYNLQKHHQNIFAVILGGEIKHLNTLKMLLFYPVLMMKVHQQNNTASMLKKRKDYFCGIKMTKGTKGTNSFLH